MNIKVMKCVSLIFLLFNLNVVMAQESVYKIILKDHKFNPTTLIIPAGEKVKIEIDNQDPTAEEFESHELNREKIIFGGKKAFIYVGPVKAGTYSYFGEFNPQTAKGIIVAE